jgi:hypothetical protein
MSVRSLPVRTIHAQLAGTVIVGSAVVRGSAKLQRFVARVAPAQSTFPSAWRLACSIAGSQPSSTRLASAVEHEALYVTNETADIEPVGGWVITRPFRLEEASISGYTAQMGAPGLRRYAALRAKSFLAPVRPPVLSLRMSGERNYFHALVEILGGRLRLAEEQGVPVDTPLVVSVGLASKPFFEELQRLPALCDRQWIVQGVHQLISCERVWFAETSAYDVNNFEFARRVLGVEPSDPQSNDRLLLIRSPSAGRTVSNMNEVLDVTHRYGFRAVDTAVMSLAQQRHVFSSAGFVIATHGAGLTNLLFRRSAPLQVLEIFPFRSGHPKMYRLLAESSGFGYRSMHADNEDVPPWRKPFIVNVERLRQNIEEMLSC